MKQTDINRLFVLIFVYIFFIFLLLYRRIASQDKAGGVNTNQISGGGGTKNNKNGNRDSGKSGRGKRGGGKPRQADVVAMAPNDRRKNWNWGICILAAAAFFVRIAFSSAIEGFPSDIACFKAWSGAAADNFIALYDKTASWFIDYPPGYMYVLLLLGKIRELFNIPPFGELYTTLIKLPSIIADVICGLLLYYITGQADIGTFGDKFYARLSINKQPPAPASQLAPAELPGVPVFSEGARLLFAAFYFFNPVVFFISTVWGQVDSILTMLVLLAVLTFISGHYRSSGVFYALSALIKPQGIIFFPVAFFMLLHKFLIDRDLRPALKMIASALAAAIIVILPFSLRHGPLWIIDLYSNTLSGYKLASMNAFNFFALLGGNWINDSQVLVVFTYAAWGMIAIVVSTLLSGVFIVGSREMRGTQPAYTMFMGSALIIFSVVTFGHRMHERYFFPVLLMLLSACVLKYKDDAKNRQAKVRGGVYLAAFACISLSGYLNSLFVFSAFYTNKSSDFYGDNWIYAISAVNVAAAVFIWIIAFMDSRVRGLGPSIRKSRGAATGNLKRRPAGALAILLPVLFSLAIVLQPGAAYAVIDKPENKGIASTEVSVFNPGFEAETDVPNQIPGWGVYDYREQQAGEPGVSVISIDSEIFRSGGASLRIENSSINDTRVFQRIDVDPDSVYRLSCWVKTKSVGNAGAGANISVLGIYSMSDDIKGSTDDFLQIELYGRTGPDQKDLWLAVGLGGYSNESEGTAWIDDVRLEKLDGVPNGANVQPLSDDMSVTSGGEERTNEISVGARVILFLLIVILLALIALMTLRYQDRDRKPHGPPGEGSGSGGDGGDDNNGGGGSGAGGSGGGAGSSSGSGSSGGDGGSSGCESGGGSADGGKNSGNKNNAAKSDSGMAPAKAKKNSRSAQAPPPASPKKSGRTMKWLGLDRADIIIIASISAAYLALSLFRLGGRVAPQTYWKPGGMDDSVVFTFDGPVSLTGVMYNCNAIQHSESESAYDLYVTPPGGGEEELIYTFENKAFYEWLQVNFSATEAISVRISPNVSAMALNEIAFLGKGNGSAEKLLPVRIDAEASAVSGSGEGSVYNLIDEQHTVPDRPDILNGTYFDEIYFARTAYEFLHSLTVYETTHPPLGKAILAIGIIIFGMNPFGWRIMGALAGVALIPVMYIFGKKLFGKRVYAFCAAFLMMFDFMHFAQSRLATIDSYVTLLIVIMYMFMLDSFMEGIESRPIGEVLPGLCASGLAFGLGVAVKWIALYAGAGLAFLFFLGRAAEIQNLLFPANAMGERGVTRSSGSWRSFFRGGASRKKRRNRGAAAGARLNIYYNRLFAVALACVLFFVLVPGIIYLLSYLPQANEPGASQGLFKTMQESQKSMYDYHSRLTDTHPFESAWWKWPLEIRPLWMYSATGLPPSHKADVVSFGNPLIWWTGIPCLVAAFILAYRKNDKRMAVVFTAFIFQYAPWMFIMRATFIYHYYSAVPFVIMAIVYIIRELVESKAINMKAVGAYLSAVAILFVIYYPILSGLPVTKGYSEALRFFSTWLW